MSQRSVKKGKKPFVFGGQTFSSSAITQTVCFFVVACVAVLGFIQTRRAIYRYGEAATFSQSGMYSDGSGDVSEVPADQMPTDEGQGTEGNTTADSTTTTTKKTAKKTSKKTTASTSKDDSDAIKVKILVSPVNIRTGAGSDFSVIGRTTGGKVFRLISEKKGSDGKQWYQIELDDGKSGWILATCARVLDNSDEKTTGASSKETGSSTQTSKTKASKTKASKKTTTAASDVSSDSKDKTTKKTTAKSSKSTKATSTTLATKTTAKVADKTQTTKKTEKPETTASATSDESFDLSKLKKVVITETPVNIRSGPGGNYEIIEKTEKGKEFGLISSKKGEDGKTWCRIALSTDKSGWILRSCCRDAEETTTSSDTQDKLLMKLQPEDKNAKYFIVVYIGSQSTVVYKKDGDGNYTKQVKVFTCSTGKESSPTRTGKYHIRAKYRWRWLVGNVYGQYNSSISQDYLFHSVPYYKKDFKTLENEEYDKLGTPASKGCIRMCVRDCKWIYDNCEIGTQVRIVTDSGPAGPGVPKRKTESKYSGWDPSDKWAQDNPYFS